MQEESPMHESSRSTAAPPGTPDRKAQAKALGARVTEFRKERGLNLTQLAAAAQLSKSYISSIEAGEAPRPSGETLYAIAEALGVTMSDLLGRRLLPDTNAEPTPQSLLEFAKESRIPE